MNKTVLDRFLFAKIWGWLTLGMSAVYNLVGVHIPGLQGFPWEWTLFFLLVIPILFLAELVLLAGKKEETANQVGLFCLLWMVFTAIWTVFFSPLLPLA